MSAFRKYLRAFAANRRGNVAMIYGLALLPLAMASGAAVDFARAMIVRSSMAEALDAAGLAVGGSPAMVQADMEHLAQAYFNANYKQDLSYGKPTDVRVVQNGQDFTLSSSADVPTLFLGLVKVLQLPSIDTLPVSYSVTITRNSINLEVAVALDITGSMAGQRLTDLKTGASDLVDLVVQDQQSPTYSKVAIIPYSMAVNVGSYADQVRGTIKGPTAITNVAGASGTAKTITKATKKNPVVITTSTNHGFVNGNSVVITNVGGMKQINYDVSGTYYVVANATATTFELYKADGTTKVDGSNYSSYSSGGTVTKCQISTCEVVVTSAAHGLATGDDVYITGVSGMTQINNTIGNLSSPNPACNGNNQPCSVWPVSVITSSTFALTGSNATYTAYTSGGSAYCVKDGCQYYRFQNPSNNWLMYPISTCVTERTTDAYNDTAPSSTPLGRNYHNSSANPCLTPTIVPLSTDRTSLKASINGFTAGGSTAGHIGVAWAWYMLSPQFAYLWPSGSQPSAYHADNVLKFAVIMTDGAFNTPYCKGVISSDAASGSGNGTDHINCAAPNGSSASQALSQCTAMKTAGVIVYTVGFDIASDTTAIKLLTDCATDSAHAYFPATGSDLKNDFHDIAQQITNLRVKS